MIGEFFAFFAGGVVETERVVRYNYKWSSAVMRREVSPETMEARFRFGKVWEHPLGSGRGVQLS